MPSRQNEGKRHEARRHVTVSFCLQHDETAFEVMVLWEINAIYLCLLLWKLAFDVGVSSSDW